TASRSTSRAPSAAARASGSSCPTPKSRKRRPSPEGNLERKHPPEGCSGMAPTSHPLVESLRAAMRAAADPAVAAGMQAYMKTDQPFYGIQADPRRRLFKETAHRFPIATRAEYEAVVRALWEGPCREDQYQAIEAAGHYRRFHDAASWPLYEHLVRTATHWDTLDWIAGRLLSPLVLRHRAFEADLARWAQDDNLWVRRAALLAHLHHRDQTNTAL